MSEKQQLTIYLTGPILKCWSYWEGRPKVKAALEADGHECLEPTDQTRGWADEQVKIDRSDVVIAIFSRESDSMMRGIEEGVRTGKPVILIDPRKRLTNRNDIDSFLLKEIAPKALIVQSVEDALAKLARLDEEVRIPESNGAIEPPAFPNSHDSLMSNNLEAQTKAQKDKDSEDSARTRTHPCEGKLQEKPDLKDSQSRPECPTSEKSHKSKNSSHPQTLPGSEDEIPRSQSPARVVLPLSQVPRDKRIKTSSAGHHRPRKTDKKLNGIANLYFVNEVSTNGLVDSAESRTSRSFKADDPGFVRCQ